VEKPGYIEKFKKAKKRGDKGYTYRRLKVGVFWRELGEVRG